MSFSKNVASNECGSIFINNTSMVSFEKNSIAFFNSNTASIGGVICSRNDSHITTKGISKFNGNSAAVGGAIVCYNKCTLSLVENSTVKFINNNAIIGGVSFLFNNSNIVFDDDAIVVFINNSATNWDRTVHSVNILERYAPGVGGALAVYNSNFTAKGNSIIKFYNNSAVFGSGALAYHINCNIIFKENSSLIFNYNRATHGGAIGCKDHSVVMAEGNSNVFFIKNKAKSNDGGAFCGFSNSNFIFKNKFRNPF